MGICRGVLVQCSTVLFVRQAGTVAPMGVCALSCVNSSTNVNKLTCTTIAHGRWGPAPCPHRARIS